MSNRKAVFSLNIDCPIRVFLLQTSDQSESVILSQQQESSSQCSNQSIFPHNRQQQQI